MKKRIFGILVILFTILVSLNLSYTQSENDREKLIKKILLEIETIKSKIDPQNPVNDYLKIAHLYIQIDDFTNAISYINNAIQLDPKNPRAYYLLALIYEKKKNYTKAINLWQKVLDYSTTKEMKEIAQKHIEYLKQIKK